MVDPTMSCPRVEAEERLTRVINETLERKGKVLIPVPAVGERRKLCSSSTVT